MQEVIDLYKKIVIQIATPYSTGTGFYLKEHGVIVTNEHVVRDNQCVVINGVNIDKQLVKVIFIDTNYDIAFLEAPKGKDIPSAQIGSVKMVSEGTTIIAIGHPLGLRYTATQGIISNMQHLQGDIVYIQHDAALNPGNSGGPLVDTKGFIIGVNTFIMKDGNSIGFSLPIRHVIQSIQDFKAGNGKIGIRCESCLNLVFEDTIDGKYCPHCGTKAVLPTQADPYEPIGISRTIENLLTDLGYEVNLSRRGPNIWQVQNGSARINISYHEKTGLIEGDAFLCTLPKENIKSLYEYLLKENYHIEGLMFSVKGNDIILSLLIYDRYFNEDTGMKLFQHLFQKADDYDNVLVEQYGAHWRQEFLSE